VSGLHRNCTETAGGEKTEGAMLHCRESSSVVLIGQTARASFQASEGG
jgi:hypothetical protein